MRGESLGEQNSAIRDLTKAPSVEGSRFAKRLISNGAKGHAMRFAGGRDQVEPQLLERLEPKAKLSVLRIRLGRSHRPRRAFGAGQIRILHGMEIRTSNVLR